MTVQMAHEVRTEFYILHRMPRQDSGGRSQSTTLATYLGQCAASLVAGFDGCLLPTSSDASETLSVDGFTIAGSLLALTPRGKVGLADVSLAILAPDDILRRASVLAALAPGRLELGLSLGRPRDFWASNVHAGRARTEFASRMEALLWAFGYIPKSRAVATQPAFRALQAWSRDLAAPRLFVSGTYCAENREALQGFDLPWLSYGDPMDGTLDSERSKGCDLVLNIDLTGQAKADEASQVGDSRLFGPRGAQPGYYDADEYRLRLIAATDPRTEVLSGSVSDVAHAIRNAARTALARRIVIDPCVGGLSGEALDANFAAATAELLPALRKHV